MKLWLQSGSGLSADSGTAYGSRYERALLSRLNAVVRSGTTFVIRGIDGTPFGKDRYHAAKHLVVTGVIKSALRAEREGYDAVAVINTFDHGYYELRELLRIPVVFITESTLHRACQLAPRVAVIGHNTQIRRQVEELGRRYGMGERLVPGESLDLTYDDFPKLYEDPPAYVERFRAAARSAMARGADAFLAAGNPLNMFLVEHGVTEVDGAPLVDGTAAVVEAAQTAVDAKAAGIAQSGTDLVEAPSDDDLAKLRALYD